MNLKLCQTILFNLFVPNKVNDREQTASGGCTSLQIYQTERRNMVAKIPKNIKGGANCTICYGAHHGENCRRFWERCFECHVPAQSKTDHAEKCHAKDWFKSEKYVNVYVKKPAIRSTITFEMPIRYLLYGEFVEAKTGMELFSAVADVHFEFVSPSKIAIKTSGFTRIRLPVIVDETDQTFTERLVFMTSHDRTLVAANSSRVVNHSNILSDFDHNTPLVLVLSGSVKCSVEVHSGGSIQKFDIEAVNKRFVIPDELNVHAKKFELRQFDADFPYQKMKRQ